MPLDRCELALIGRLANEVDQAGLRQCLRMYMSSWHEVQDEAEAREATHVPARARKSRHAHARAQCDYARA